ncbi:MAG: FG-GAP-like repeat-containing protein, partial [Bacteroidota bacterium]
DHQSFSNGAGYSDLDNDGDLDLVVNNLDEKAFLYKNLTVEKGLGNYLKIRTKGFSQPSFAKVFITYGGTKQFVEINQVKGYLSSMNSDVAQFGLGKNEKVDTVRVEWLSGRYEERYNVKINTELIFNEKDAQLMSKPRNVDAPLFTKLDAHYFKHRENDFDDFELESLLPYKQSTLGPFIAVGDANGDQLDDFYVGGALGQSGELFIQQADGSFANRTPLAIKADAVCEDMESLFFDVDNDGDDDLYVVSGGYEYLDQANEYRDRLYINDGKGGFDKAVDQTLKDLKISGKSVATLDYNGDGLKDLVIGGRVVPGNYPKAPGAILLENTGSSFVNVTQTAIPDLASFGMINKVQVADLNNDGIDDLLVVGEWTHLGLFVNQGGTFEDISNKSGLNEKLGWWYSITETDVNQDNLPDYIIGNVGLNSKYKASVGAPLKIFADDFDANGSWDIVLSNKYKGEYVPFRGRECSSNQMPFITKQFPTYDMFAKATIEDVYGEKLNIAFQRQVNEFRSVVLINEGEERFRVEPLPIEAQLFPMLAAQTLDVNNDGLEDIIAAGTIFNTEVETPRLDAGSGLLLMADASGKYKPVGVRNSGLFIDGNVKSVVKINIAGKSHLIFGRNNSDLVFLKLN